MKALNLVRRLNLTNFSSKYHTTSSTYYSQNLWSHLDIAPFDGNHATAEAYEKDSSPLKVNLGRGVYKDDKGKNWILPCVTKAEAIIAANSSTLGHEYLPFKGLADFTRRTSEFAFGKDSSHLKEGKIATVQSLSGTGALRIGAEFLKKYRPAGSPNILYLPDPSYVNHLAVFGAAVGFELKYYPYYDITTNSLNLKGMLEAIKNAPPMSIILLHACAHNPTGIDPTLEQWKEISEVIKGKNLTVFFDSAYQGFASGDPDKDAAPFRYFVKEGHQILVAQSYAKNFGLYGQRIGALNVVTNNSKETEAVMSQLNQVIRPMYSNPPLHGARIVSTVFGDEALNAQWRKDVKVMADRIIGARQSLVDNLKGLGSKRSWNHITNQIGMFAYSGLSEKEVRLLRELHVFMNLDGRMSISGINSGNVKYLAESMHKVTSKKTDRELHMIWNCEMSSKIV